MSMRLASAETVINAGELPVWLCTLRLPDGRALRFSTRAIEVATAWTGGGGPFQFDPFLVGVSDFEEEVDVFSLDGVGALTQARVEVCVPGTSLAALQGAWYAVTAATVELAIVWDGQAWEDRIVVLDGGTVQSAELGFDGQSSSFTVESTPPSSSATIGDDSRDMGDDWPPVLLDDLGAGNEMTDVSGAKYQRVYGAPESVPAYKIGNAGSVGDNRIILAGHAFARSGASYEIDTYADGVAGATTPYTVVNGTTPGGLPYAYIDHASEFRSSSGAITFKANYGGIAAADGADRAALNADGVVRKLLTESGLPVDWRQTEPCLAKLRDWRIGFFCDQEALAIDVLRDRVLAYLPVIEMSSGDGLWLYYCDPHHAPIEANLIVGQHLIARVGRMGISDLEAIRNQFTINYAKEQFSGELLATATLNATNSGVCYLSQQLYGVRAADAVDCDVTWDAATALRMLTTQADRLALPRRILQYQVAPDAYWLRAGAVVALTDAGISVDRHRAVITKINRSMYPFEATLHLVDRTPMAREFA